MPLYEYPQNSQRLNHGHGRHESVTRLGVLGDGESNERGLHLLKWLVLSKKGLFGEGYGKLEAYMVLYMNFAK
jgi:hypothetical protein